MVLMRREGLGNVAHDGRPAAKGGGAGIKGTEREGGLRRDGDGRAKLPHPRILAVMGF